ncbi:alpha/beta hydrolase [Butyrivibrio sp. VCD2006]|uniref:alpha/beta hydrolase n=1 Tax=Butyrivibrio sp. VCD2006 TaxID=1280664 RepID=UPI000419B376|nr:alpha/beta hydrolase [Butyrivibrio sp. VCD2006]
MNKIDFLGEDDFLEVMQSENLQWQNTSTKQGDFSSFDGTKLRFYCAVPEAPRAVITIVHGFCEFFGKYHEYAWYLYKSGYAVYFLEQRGHGYSEGKLKEPDVVFIDDYDTYVEDLKSFLDKVVFPETEGLKKILLAHSMGGAVSTLFLEKYKNYFDAAILSSPMLKMKNNTSPLLIKLLSIYSFLFGKRKTIAPGQRHFDPTPVFENSSTLSKARYDYMFEMRKKDWHYQTYGASIGWALASLKVTDRIMKGAPSLKIPITVFTAGQDHLINPEGYTKFAELVPDAKFIHFEKSRHEIFNADDESRKQYFAKVLEILDTLVSKQDSQNF